MRSIRTASDGLDECLVLKPLCPRGERPVETTRTCRETETVAYEQIWAPWRMPYIQSVDQEPEPEDQRLELLPGADPHCFICQAVADSADRQRHVVQRGERSIVILNRYPYNNGHLLVAPLLHQARLDQLDSHDHLELAQMVTRMIGFLENILHPEGFNVGLNLGRAAGAGLPGHLHWHVIPRWNGDTSFMTAVASVNVIPQSLDVLWEAMAEQTARQGQ